MSIMIEVQRLAQAGKAKEGIALIERAAQGGEPEAMLVLANWRLWGLYGARDLAATHALLARAAAAGSGEAAMLRATLIGNGTGCSADPVAARALLAQMADTPQVIEQVDLLDAMDSRAAPATETLSADPDVRMIAGFLSERECAYLIARADPLLRPSMILDQQTGRPRPHPVRTSSNMNFDPTNEDLVVNALNRRIAAATATDYAAGEPLHILRYTPGQEFRPHLDAISGADNQREWTALIYLNDGFGGGETVFPELGITTLGRPGDCLVFRVCAPNGTPDLRLRHAGLPVTSGVKWLASRWIRQQPYEAEVLR
jgi:prolyl 4-hydroxylase